MPSPTLFTLCLLSASWSALTSAQQVSTTATQTEGRTLDHSNDPLDDEAVQNLQQSLNQVYNSYNSQISAKQAEIDKLKATGVAQCQAEASQQIAQANQAAKEAKSQALGQMIGPASQALGQMMQSGHGAAMSEEETIKKRRSNAIEACNEEGLECSETGASVNAAKLKAKCTPEGATAVDETCAKNMRAAARDYDDQILKMTQQANQVSEAGGSAMGTMLQLGAAGMMGMMSAKSASEAAKLQIGVAEESQKLCETQVASALNDLERQKSQLEQAKARDILMANMQAEYQTQLRRKASGEVLDTSGIDQGGLAALDGEDPGLMDPNLLPIKKAGKNSGGDAGGGDAGGGAGAGGGGGGAPAPSWAFGGGGGGFDGGNSLPMQPKGAKFSGAAMSAANTGKGGGMGGFGALETKGNLNVAGNQEEIFEINGDGGLRVLLARTSLVHARHSPELVKGIDFDRLAKLTNARPPSNKSAQATSSNNDDRSPANMN